MKPQCRSCHYHEANTHSDEWYCMHEGADGAKIEFDYIQQRRPAWCPLTKEVYIEPPKEGAE